MKYFFYILFLLLANFVNAQKIVPLLTKNNIYTFVDSETLKPAFSGEFDSTDGFIGSFAKVEVSNKYGFIDKNGNSLIPIEYNKNEIGYELLDKNYVLIYELKNNFYNVRCFQVKDFKEVFSFSVEEIKQNKLKFKTFKNDLLISTNKSKENIYGLYSIDTGWKIPLYSNKFEEIEIFRTIENEKYSNQFIAVKQNNKWGILSLHNLEANAIFDEIKDIGKNLFKVKKGNLWAVMDIDQNLLTDFIFSDIDLFFLKNDDRCAVKFTDKWGFIDSKAKLIIPAIYDEIKHFENGLAAVAKKIKVDGYENNKVLKNFIEELRWGVIDEFNNVKIDFLYSTAPVFGNNEFTIVDKVINNELQKDIYSSLNTGRVIKKRKAKAIILYKNGNEKLLLDKYFVDSNYQSNLPMIEILDKTTLRKRGLININQEMKISPIYSSISKLCCEDLHTVFNGKYGVINKNGILILPVIYDEIETLYNVIDYTFDYILLKKGDKYFIADKNGKLIAKEQYDGVNYIKDYFVVINQNKYGLINKKGEKILPLEYDKISIVGPYIEIFKNEKYGLINSNFQKILDLKYNMIAYSDLSVSISGMKIITGVYRTDCDGLPLIKVYDGIEWKDINLNKDNKLNLKEQNKIYKTSNGTTLPYYSFGTYHVENGKLFKE
jgi:hypothetical protein